MVTLPLAVADPVLNMMLLVFNDEHDKQFWVLNAHAMFGVGCLLGPFVVYLF
jgi:hypothetical protein